MWCVLVLWPVFGKENDLKKKVLCVILRLKKVLWSYLRASFKLSFDNLKTFSWPFKPKLELLK